MGRDLGRETVEPMLFPGEQRKLNTQPLEEAELHMR